MAEKIPDIFFTLEKAPIMFRNFSGRKTQFNREGDRNFCIDLTNEPVEDMLAMGWNVKYLQPKEEGDLPRPYIQVAVKWSFKPPRLVMVTSKKQTNLTEDMVEVLDFAELTQVDVIVRGWHWINGEGTDFETRGVKAELKTGYFTIFEDELELKYNAMQAGVEAGVDD